MENTTVLNLSAADLAPAFPKIAINRAGWVTYGPGNNFPQEIIKYNSKSPVNRAIIESTVTYVLGKGVKNSTSKFVGAPSPNVDWDEVVEPVAKDFKTFGGFYLQIIVNNDTATVSVFHQDYSAVRIGLTSETGEPLTFRISNDWTKTQGKYKPIELEAWPGMAKAEKGKSYLYHYWTYEPGLSLYSVPDWFAAMEYVKADGALGLFYNNSIANGFAPSVVIKMPSNPSEPKKAEFQRQMEGAFSGPTGASSIVILWGENDAVRPDIVPFSASANANIYNEVEGIIFQKIISAHRLSSPTLAGVSGSGNLSGNASEIIDAFILYNYTVIEKMRKVILDKLNIFTAINKTSLLYIEDLDVLPKIAEANNPDQITTTTENGEPTGSLAAEIGVGGTQAMTAIIESPNMPDDQKRGLLKTLFGLDDETVESLFSPKKMHLTKKTSPLKRFEKFIKSFK